MDLISLIARENRFEVDEIGFQEELNKQKARSRAATGIETDDWHQIHPDVVTTFVGYDHLELPVKILKYRKVTQNQKTFYQLVFDQTPFYAEGGGQVGDTGEIYNDHETVRIFDTKKENNLWIHLSQTLPTKLDDGFTAKVDAKRRNDIMKNHSATHLLHHALRTVLGSHVEQKGSLVGPDYMRFDFSHFAKIAEEEMTKIVQNIEQQIKENIELNEMRNTPIEAAKAMGAMALFGEKYGDSVRVIQFGESVELCGGTHVERTGTIGLVKIQSESAVAAGIRRIEMLTGTAAEDYYKEETALLTEIRTLFKNPKDIVKSVQDLMDTNSKIGKEVESLMKARSIQLKNDLMSEITAMGDVNILCKQMALDSNSVKDILFQLKGQVARFIGIIGNTDGDKCGVSVLISDELVAEKNLSAVVWIREAAPIIQGGGGGQPFFATAGGKNAARLPEALILLKSKI